MKIFQRLKHHRSFLASLVLLVCLVIVIGLSAYKPNTWLTGWDNLHPEFDFALNIGRNFSSAWKEFQGLGAVSGVGLSAELPHQLTLLVMSFFIATNQLRFTWTVLMLAVGCTGMAVLTYTQFVPRKFPRPAMTAFLAGAFYLLNFGTVQNFYTPFETFITQYGMLPWLVLTTLIFFKKPTFRAIVFFILALIFVMPTAYVPTVFIVTFLVIGSFVLEHFLHTRQKLKNVGLILLFGAVIVAANFHWMGPFTYYVFSKGIATATSKINQYASLDARLSNAEYGRWEDLAVMRGFWFEYLDTQAGKTPQFLMQPWREHFSQPYVMVLGLAFFVIVLLGAFFSFKKKTPHHKPLICLLLVTLVMLKSYNPPVGVVFGFLANNIPLFGEIFRYTFTKWIVVAIFCYSAFFGLGVSYLQQLLNHHFSKLRKNSTYLLTGLFTLLLVIYMWPMFAGQLFSKQNQLTIPPEYFSVMKYFKSQPKYARIATLPQYTFWGWDVYSWGYRGSGWWRHGIEQPLLERTHDVWSNENEQYYTEINAAIYSEDSSAFTDIIKKYHVGWLLVDRYLDYGNDKHLNEIKLLADKSGLFDAPITFGQLTVYPRKNLSQLAKTYLEASDASTAPESYTPLMKDELYHEAGSYLNAADPQHIPLFTHQSFDQVQRTDQEVIVQQQITLPKGSQLRIPNFLVAEEVVPATLTARREKNAVILTATPKLPKIELPGNILELKGQQKIVSFEVKPDQTNLALKVNTSDLISLSNLTESDSTLTDLYLFTKKENNFSLIDTETIKSRDLSGELSQKAAEKCGDSAGQLQKEVYEDGSFSLSATKTIACVLSTVGDLNADALTEISFETKASDTERPFVIVKNAQDGKVLSANSPEPAQFSENWQRQHFLYPPLVSSHDSPPISLQIAFGTNASDKTTLQKVYYRNLQIYQRPVLGQQSFTFITSSQENQAFQEINITAPVERVSIHFPVLHQTPATFFSAQSNAFNERTKNCDVMNSGPHQKTLSSSVIEYSAENSSECDSWDFTHHQTNFNYLLEITSLHQAGKPLEICLANSQTLHCQVNEQLSTRTEKTTQFFPVLASSSQAQGYILQVSNQSIGRIKTVNQLYNVNLYPFPLNWITQTFVSVPSPALPALKLSQVERMHASLYFFQAETPSKDSTFSLSQGYDPGWQAFLVNSQDFAKPFLFEQLGFGKKAGVHLKKNSWENGWVVSPPNSSQQTITIAVVFLPFILQLWGWLSFLFLIFTLLIYSLQKAFRKLFFH